MGFICFFSKTLQKHLLILFLPMNQKNNKYLFATAWLGLLAGFTDAYLFHITEVFPANMSGNFVILSLNLAQGKLIEGWEKIVALLSFILGVGVATVVLQSKMKEIYKTDGLVIFKTLVIMTLAAWFYFELPIYIEWIIFWSSFIMGIQGAYAVKIGVTTNTLVLTNNIVLTVSGFTSSLFASKAEERKAKYPVSQFLVLIVYFLGAVLSCIPKEPALLLWMLISYGWMSYYFLSYRALLVPGTKPSPSSPPFLRRAR